MGTIWNMAAAITSIALLSAAPAAAQTQTISARPGAINYIEGAVSINNKTLSSSDLRATFLNGNDLLSTANGKAEVLLTPGVFLRVGENSEIRMVSPSLTDTQVELTRGEAMVEATGLVKDNNLQIIDHGSITTIRKNGLYRFTADVPPLVAVFDGKAEVELDDRKVNLKKGRQTVIAAGAKTEKFDRDKGETGDLYAWSNVRSEYEAAASYRVSRNASMGMLGGAGYGLGPGAFGSGWYWDNGFSSYAWLPGSGAFYSPFGYGFYSPGLVGYAPVVVGPVYGGGRYYGGDRRWDHHPGTGQWNGHPPAGSNGWRPGAPGSGSAGVGSVPVPVRPPGGWHGANGGPGSWHNGAGASPGIGSWHNGSGAGAWHGGGGSTGGASSGAARPSFGGNSGGGGWHGGGSPGGHSSAGPRGK